MTSPTINYEYLQQIVLSDKSVEVIFDELVNSAKEAKEAGMTHQEAVILFGKLWDIRDDISSELDGCISTINDMVLGHCATEVRLWGKIWDSTNE